MPSVTIPPASLRMFTTPNAQSQLRAQLLSQLQKGQIVALGPPPGDRPGLKRHALNSLIADYMRTVQYNYSLSVFKEESGVESRPLLTEDEVLDVLKLDRETSFFQSYMKAKAHGTQEALAASGQGESCTMLAEVQAGMVADKVQRRCTGCYMSHSHRPEFLSSMPGLNHGSHYAEASSPAHPFAAFMTRVPLRRGPGQLLPDEPHVSNLRGSCREGDGVLHADRGRRPVRSVKRTSAQFPSSHYYFPTAQALTQITQMP